MNVHAFFRMVSRGILRQRWIYSLFVTSSVTAESTVAFFIGRIKFKMF